MLLVVKLLTHSLMSINCVIIVWFSWNVIILWSNYLITSILDGYLIIVIYYLIIII